MQETYSMFLMTCEYIRTMYLCDTCDNVIDFVLVLLCKRALIDQEQQQKQEEEEEEEEVENYFRCSTMLSTISPSSS